MHASSCIFLVKGSSVYNNAKSVYCIHELATRASPKVKLYTIAGGDHLTNFFTNGFSKQHLEA